MTACKCRRCGKLYEHYTGVKVSDSIMESNGIIFADTKLSGNRVLTTQMDLCPECMAGMAAWWNKNKEPEGITRKEA